MKYLLLLALVISLLITFPGCAAPEKTNMPIVLLTDFGTDDYRVPRLKGVIYTANPDALVIDATHGIASVDIAAGAYVLGLTAAEFPEKTVFLAAVGAGSTPDEKTLVVINNKGQIFVLPDNGLITFVAKNMGIKNAYAVTDTSLFDKPMAQLSSHQILGKVAALVAGGYKPEKLGAVLDSPVLLDIQEAAISNGKLTGYVVFVDHYGSCLTNISRDIANQFGLTAGVKIKITAAGAISNSVIGTRYGDVAVGESVSMVNSLDILQLSINKGSFAAKNNVKTGAMVVIEKSAP
jgi:S-adenosyl-L-methionine hydrolase (adenosine-forming)